MFHEWKPIAVQTRFQPFRDLQTGEIIKDVGTIKTDVLYRCTCGKLKVRAIRGEWTLQQVTA